jgi:hypothetical protein
MDLPGRAQIRDAVNKAERFLVQHQAPAGYWCDYDLEPGASLGWVTAYVGFCLTCIPTAKDNLGPIRAAARTLHDLETDFGWGYNRQTAPDADTTSWVFRFLARIDSFHRIRPREVLQKYILKDGSACTYNDPATFGTWADAHEDVTPVLGLALLETGADSELVLMVRHAVIRAWNQKERWDAFWWEDNAYAWAKNLEYLHATGGIPDPILQGGRQWLYTRPPSNNALNVSRVLNAAIFLRDFLSESGRRHLLKLLELQKEDGGWDPSPGLRVPAQKDGGRSCLIYSDQKGLMSTASAVMALKKIISAWPIGTNNSCLDQHFRFTKLRFKLS